MFQPGIGYTGVTEVERLQRGERIQEFEIFIADRRPMQVDGDQRLFVVKGGLAAPIAELDGRTVGFRVGRPKRGGGPKGRKHQW